MKHSSNGAGIALSLIVIVTVTGCPMITAVPAREPRIVVIISGPTIDPSNPVIPDPVELAVPVFFYMDGRTPTMRDTGRTGFMAAYMEAAGNLVVVSDDRETDDHPVVYFYGIEDISRVEVRFDRESDFPSGFAIYQEGLPPTEGGLSEYNEKTETFSLELRCGADVETYPGLVLNKSLFDAYPEQGDMTESRYRRVKNILTSLALWTSVAYQTGDTVPADGAWNVARVVFASSPEILAVSSAEAVLDPIATEARVVAASVSIATIAGAAILNSIAASMPDEETPPPDEPPVVEVPITINPGDPGPAGGVLLGKLNGADDWTEVAPKDIGRFRMSDGAAEKACEAYSVTVDGTKIDGWFLPDSGTLQTIYVNLY
jgi:hypothetical protein